MTLDSHLHVWDLTRSRYGWLDAVGQPLARSISLDEVRPALRDAGVAGVILVQADDTDEETDFLLELSSADDIIVGVVGSVPLHEPDRAIRRLDEITAHPKLVGIRNLTHDRSDPDWILRPDIAVTLAELERRSLPLDYVAVLPRHLENLSVLAERHPGLPIVLDHLAKPPIGGPSPAMERWRDGLAEAAGFGNVVAKVSGLYGATRPEAWNVAQLRSVIEHALATFGSDRLMYGGDWPVSLTAGGYRPVWEGIAEVLADLSPEQREDILTRTATRIYLSQRGPR